MKTPDGVGAAKAVSAASATVSDMGQFCTRQPDACEVGSQALTQFGHKAQASAKWLYDFLTEKLGTNTASVARQPKAVPAEFDCSQNTLTAVRYGAGMARPAAAGRGEALVSAHNPGCTCTARARLYRGRT